jgi:hypothetical protein
MKKPAHHTMTIYETSGGLVCIRIRGCANLQVIIDNQRGVIQQQANEMNRLAQENYELRMQVFEQSSEFEDYDPAPASRRRAPGSRLPWPTN